MFGIKATEITKDKRNIPLFELPQWLQQEQNKITLVKKWLWCFLVTTKRGSMHKKSWKNNALKKTYRT